MQPPPDDPKKTAEVQEALRQLREDAMAKKPIPRKMNWASEVKTTFKDPPPKKPTKKAKR